MKKLWEKLRGWFKAAVHHALSYFLHYLAILSIGLLVTYFKSIRDSLSIGYYLKSAVEWVTPLTISFLTVGLVSVFIYALKQRGEIVQLRQKSQTLAGFGVRAFSAHDSASSKEADWKMIEADLRQASEAQSPLKLLGATGKRTFADTDAPLHKAVCEYEGPIQVLLVRPGSAGFEHRVQRISANPEQYIDEILDTLEFCKSLARKGRRIEVKLYESMPIWKMLSTPQILWLQHYAQSKHVDETPAYGFAASGQRPTILDGFRSVFDKRWDHDESKEVNLRAFERSRWQDHC